MHALGMSYKDISQHIEEIYTFCVSSATLIVITDKIIPEL
jgi:putative transposase